MAQRNCLIDCGSFYDRINDMRKVYKRTLFFIVVWEICFGFAFGNSKITEKKLRPRVNYKCKKVEGGAVQANEVWAWVTTGQEEDFDFNYPVTDVGYFAADVDCYGELANVPDRKKFDGFSGRVHLVIVCDSKSLTHFVVDPKYGILEKMVNDVMKAAEPFDGVNVDYELIPGKDAANFYRFLDKLSSECKRRKKMFSVCVPARVKKIDDDVFPYDKIAAISDRVMIMAYDEHWSTGEPGAIASLGWCKKIIEYAVTVIPKEKLVMGLPFYGRSWADERPAKAWYWEGVNRAFKEYGSGKVIYDNTVPTFEGSMKVKMKFWFEDLFSTVAKLRLYAGYDVNNFAFWRVGQEDPRIWDWITIDNDAHKKE